MAQALVVPTIFSVIDDVSPRLNAMQHNVTAFGTRAENSVSRADRAFRRLTPGLSAVQSQLLSMVGTGALLAGGVQLGAFSFNAAADYESAVDQFRVIVSDLNDADFKPFQDKIDQVAKDTKRSGTEVAQAFEKIAGINSTFAQTSEGLGQVTAATITLAKASKMDLGVAAENLVGIMNQFSFSADKADRTINALAAGQAVGAANITQTAEAFTVFGAIASSANITLEQSVGLIQTLGKYSLYGAEAGTKLRGVIMRLQKAGIGYASGQFNVNDALKQTNDILSKVTSNKQKDMLVNKLFGVENVTAGKILLKNIDTYNNFTSAVTGTQEAQKGAAINTGNLRSALGELSAAWVNTVTGTDSAKDSITQLSKGVHWVTENLGTITSYAYTAGKAFLYYAAAATAVKTVLIASRVAVGAYNIVLGLHTGLTLASTAALKGNVIATKAAAVGEALLGATIAITTGNWAALNAVMMANPIGLIVTGVVALGAATYFAYQKTKELREEYQKSIALKHEAVITSESKAVEKLANHYRYLGFAVKEANAMAVRTEKANIDSQRQVLADRINELKSRTEGKKFASNSPFAMLYNSAVSNSADNQELNKLQSQDAVLATRGRQNAQMARNYLDAGLIDQKGLGNTFGVKASSSSASAFTDLNYMGKSSNPMVMKDAGYRPSDTDRALMEKLEITVKNDADNSVSVSYGKTKLMDVTPKVGSTKTIDRSGGR